MDSDLMQPPDTERVDHNENHDFISHSILKSECSSPISFR